MVTRTTRNDPGTTRADHTNVKKKLSQREDDKTTDYDTKICISVCGVKVKEDIMRKKCVNKKTLLSIKKNMNEEKNVKTTPSVNKISKYLVRKNEDNQSLKTTSVKEMIKNLEDKKPALLPEKTKEEENSKVKNLRKIYDDKNIMKKTFSNLPVKKYDNIQKKIQKYQKYQEASDNSDSFLF